MYIFFTPEPAEYGAEEFSLDAVPTLGLVRIGPRYGTTRAGQVSLAMGPL